MENNQNDGDLNEFRKKVMLHFFQGLKTFTKITTNEIYESMNKSKPMKELISDIGISLIIEHSKRKTMKKIIFPPKQLNKNRKIVSGNLDIIEFIKDNKEYLCKYSGLIKKKFEWSKNDSSFNWKTKEEILERKRFWFKKYFILEMRGFDIKVPLYDKIEEIKEEELCFNYIIFLEKLDKNYFEEELNDAYIFQPKMDEEEFEMLCLLMNGFEKGYFQFKMKSKEEEKLKFAIKYFEIQLLI